MIPANFKGAALPRSPNGVWAAAATIKCSPDIIRAVIDVETSGSGYLPDGRLQPLFERHCFHHETGGKFDASHPDISNPTPGGYLGGAREYDRINLAMSLDRTAALKSTSWGLPQIMGSNFALAGFADVETMVTAFCNSEDEQLQAMAAFIVAAHLADDLQREDVADFARGYNGPNYAVNQYDKKIVADLARIRIVAGSSAAQGWSAARQRMSQIQVSLNLRGFGPLDPDGWAGPKTSASIGRFQLAQHLPISSQPDSATIAALLGAPSVRG